jgi:hypothetical protein
VVQLAQGFGMLSQEPLYAPHGQDKEYHGSENHGEDEQGAAAANDGRPCSDQARLGIAAGEKSKKNRISCSGTSVSRYRHGCGWVCLAAEAESIGWGGGGGYC